MIIQFMRTFLFLTIFLLTYSLQGQKRFTFVEDAVFKDPTDFFGYKFIPDLKEIPKITKSELSAGDYSFGVTANNLYLVYDGEKCLFNVQSINPTEYGFLFDLLDSRNIRETGHMKIILDKQDQVRAIVLKRTTLGKEEIYHLPLLDEYTKEREEAYYTDIIDVAVDTQDSLWGKEFLPYFMINPGEPLRKVPLMRDSVSFSFFEDIVITEKKKNKKDSSSIVDLESFDFKAMDPDSLKALSDYVKVDHKQFLSFNYAIMQENGDMLRKHEVSIITKIDEKEDASLTGLSERYMVELQLEKEASAYIYLTEYKTISSMEYRGVTYYARTIR